MDTLPDELRSVASMRTRQSDELRRISATQDQILAALETSRQSGAPSTHIDIPQEPTSVSSGANSGSNYLCARGCHAIDRRFVALVGQAVVSGILLVVSIVQIALGADNPGIYYGMIAYVAGLYSPSSKRMERKM